MPEIRHKAEIYVNYDEAQTRQNLSSGEEIRTVFGKIKKWFADMGTAAFKDVPSSGNAGSGEVVLGNDSRLSDARTPSAHNQGADTINAMTSYNKPQSTSAITTSDTLNQAVGKLEKGLDDKVSKSGDTITGDIDFYDGGVGFYPDSGHLNGIHGSGGTMWVAFNDTGDTMYVGVLGSNAKRITIDSTGIYINGYKIATLNDIPSAAVSGVKGNTETDYRTGEVNITAANIGAVRYDTSSQGLTSTQKSNARTNLGLGSAATYSSSSFASSTQGGYATDFNSNFKPIFTTSGQSHASVFRGKYLGSSFTSAQKTAIANGTFDDLFVGDYWTIGGVNWRIADINYFKSILNTNNHIVIVPDTILYNSRMNTTNNTNDGYASSEMYTTNLQNAITTIESAFGSKYIMSHVALLTNAALNGVPSGWSRYTIKCSIMPSTMLYGGRDTIGSYSDFSSGNSKAELSVFSLNKSLIPDASGANYWVRDTASAYAYNIINGINCLDAAGASSSHGVRPYFCLKGA